MKTLHVVIPGPPGHAAANRARRYVPGQMSGRPSRESKSFRSRAADALALAGAGAGVIDCDRPISVTITTWWKRWSRKHAQPLGDVDAVAKQVLDAIERSGIIVDDLLVTDLRMTKGYDPHNPRIEVTITQGDP